MVTFSFFPLHSQGDGDVYIYLLNRIFDVFIGVSLAVILESIMFPNTFLNQYRQKLPSLFKKIVLSIENKIHGLNSKDTLKEAIQDITKSSNNIAFEPRVLLSSRRKLCLEFPNLIRSIEKNIKHIGIKGDMGTNTEYLRRVVKIYQRLSHINYNDKK